MSSHRRKMDGILKSRFVQSWPHRSARDFPPHDRYSARGRLVVGCGQLPSLAELSEVQAGMPSQCFRVLLEICKELLRYDRPRQIMHGASCSLFLPVGRHMEAFEMGIENTWD